MAWLFFIITLIVAIGLARRGLRMRRLIRDLEDAARSKRRLLPEESELTLKALGVDGLVRELNDAIDRYNHHEAENAGYLGQVEAMLRAVQEVVIVFNTERKVEFANRAAERLFRNGQSLKGLRLEGVMRSLALLEFLESPEETETVEPKQINIGQDNETLWFEASCARVRSIEGGNNASSTLLVLHDITQLKRLEVMRRDFVANVSHELRTPLTIIKGFAETLVDDDATLKSDARRRFLGKIVGNAERLNVLVEDLLTLSRLESKPDQFDPVVQSLKGLMEDTIENYRPRIHIGQQVMCLSYDERVGDFAFDQYRINQVLDNLVENVFRYAPEFTSLVMKVEYDEAGNMVVCSVNDDGPGIPEKDISHIFERFYRVDKGRSREGGGTGLGLSIVKHIIQLHGGTVHAESGLEGGTSIVFKLPYKTEAAPA
ncbi:MAG: ATP-binding protein [Verrucomicrobiota bacterium]